MRASTGITAERLEMVSRNNDDISYDGTVLTCDVCGESMRPVTGGQLASYVRGHGTDGNVHESETETLPDTGRFNGAVAAIMRINPSKEDRPQLVVPEGASEQRATVTEYVNWLGRTLFDRKSEVVAGLIGLILGLAYVFGEQAVIARVVALFVMSYLGHGAGLIGATGRTRWLNSLPATWKEWATERKLVKDAHYLIGMFAAGVVVRYLSVTLGYEQYLPGPGTIPEWVYSGML